MDIQLLASIRAIIISLVFSFKMKVLWLRERFLWMGRYSGYDQICAAISRTHPGNYYTSVWRCSENLPIKGLRYLFRKMFFPKYASPFYDLSSALADAKAGLKLFTIKPKIFHITYVENNLGNIPKWIAPLGTKTIGTSHQPVSWWCHQHGSPECVSGLDALIVPSKREADFFSKYLENGVYFVPHGVDTDFFSPAPQQHVRDGSDKPIRCVYAGKWLRDIETMANVIERVLSRQNDVIFDMIVPQDARNNPCMSRIARCEQTKWHARITDNQLKNIYQNADMLVLPLLDSTANNTLLEAMACGLPVVSTDTGGVKDYTQPGFADLFPVGDHGRIVEAILRLAGDPGLRRERGIAARYHAVQNYGWDNIAMQTMDIYRQLCHRRY